MPSCRLYPLFTFAGTLNVWKTNYCTSGFAKCARYERTRRAEPVPDNLLPNGQLLKKQEARR
jgi:hypothetical protein